MALDVDDWVQAQALLADHGIDLNALYNAPDAVTINSGVSGHGKLIYKMPFGLTLTSKKIMADKKVVYELRCASASGLTVQDVIPPTIHPLTNRPYEWGGRGDWRNLPTIPMELLTLWQTILDGDKERTVTVSGTIDASWDEIKSALYTISPDCDRQQWIDCGMALHDAGTSTNQLEHAYTLWDEWSQQSQAKYKASDMPVQWRSFKPTEAGIKLGTLFHHATNSGWKRPVPDVTHLFAQVEEPSSADGLEPHRLNLKELRPIEWIQDGFMRNGVNTLVGETGVGKTSMIVPFCANVAHLLTFDGVKPPELRRKVVYYTEDAEQVEGVLYGLRKHLGGIDERSVAEWFKVIPTRRLPPSKWVGLIHDARSTLSYRDERTGFIIEPLIVLDTANASIDLDSENDNSEVGRAIAAIKQSSPGGSVLIVAHTPKALNRQDVASTTARGAGAWEGDVHGTFILFKEEGLSYRVMMSKKRRFDPDFTELHFRYFVESIIVPTPWGTVQHRRYGFSVPSCADAEKRSADKLTAKTGKSKALADAILEFIRTHQGADKYVTARKVTNEVKQLFNPQPANRDVYTEIDLLVRDELIDKINVTPEERALYGLHHKVTQHLRVVEQ